MVSSYRTVLEVLKWVSPKQTLSSAALVSKSFQVVTDSDELWFLYIDKYRLETGTQRISSLSPKLYFKTLLRYTMRNDAVLLSHQELFVYDCESGNVRSKCSTSGVTNNFSAVAFFSTKEIVVTGGINSLQCVFTYDFKNWVRKELPPMLYARYFHAIIIVEETLYAYGGNNCPNTAEKYAISTQEWTTLPNMISPHRSFNVCFRDHWVYLCGGCTIKCEAFDCETDSFVPLDFDLGETTFSVSFIYESELIVLSGANVYYLDRKERETKTSHLGLIP